MKNIWILNHYATSMFYEQGGRHYSFAKYLVRDGYKPVIFCASTIHNKQQQIDLSGALYVEKTSDIGAPFVFVKAREYVANGKARVLNMLDFYRNVITARLYGEGADREELETYCKEHALHNVRFKGRVEKKYIPYVRSKSSMNVLNHAPNPILH